MPRMDGTGPMGAGSFTGGGFGPCVKANTNFVGGYGRGARGCGRGYGRGFIAEPADFPARKELLAEKKEILERRLKMISSQLSELEPKDK
ncbi:MAG TPA: DUF5320 domain-containing protein [Oscillospiraceae bacterium]|nr:DUF5320 domain-containing protein [Oscillospiraceae bacterium]